MAVWRGAQPLVHLRERQLVVEAVRDRRLPLGEAALGEKLRKRLQLVILRRRHLDDRVAGAEGRLTEYLPLRLLGLGCLSFL